jgi:hypothetical protein
MKLLGMAPPKGKAERTRLKNTAGPQMSLWRNGWRNGWKLRGLKIGDGVPYIYNYI